MEKKSSRTEDKQEDKQCYNCVDKNHLSTICLVKEKRIKYFKCDKYDSIAINYSNMLAKNEKQKTGKYNIIRFETNRTKKYYKNIISRPNEWV